MQTWTIMKNTLFEALNKYNSNIDLQILENGYYMGGRDWRHFNINSPFNRLYFILEGEGTVYNNLERISLKPGNMYLIPSNITYNYTCDDHLVKFYIHFKAEILFGIDIFKDMDKSCSSFFDIQLLQDLIQKSDGNYLDGVFALRAYFVEMIFRLLREAHINIFSDYERIKKFENIFKFAKDNCNARLSPAAISNHLNVSQSLLSRTFKAETGQTIKKMIDNMLIQKSKEKLLLTDIPIKDIAAELQFSDEFYFSRFFKKNTGQSPRNYRVNNMIR